MPPSTTDEIVRRPLSAGNRYSPQQTTTLDKVMQRYYDRQRVMRMNANPESKTAFSCSSKEAVTNDDCSSLGKEEAGGPFSPPAAPATPKSRVIEPIQPEQSDTKDEDAEKAESQPNGIDHLRKAGVAVAGGALVGIGAVLVPLPIPAGFLTMGAGMAVLGTEFPEAQRVLDNAVDKVVEVLEPTEEKNDDVEMNGLEGASYALKKQAEKLGQRVLPLIRKESCEEKEPDCDVCEDKEGIDLPTLEVEESSLCPAS